MVQRMRTLGRWIARFFSPRRPAPYREEYGPWHSWWLRAKIVEHELRREGYDAHAPHEAPGGVVLVSVTVDGAPAVLMIELREGTLKIYPWDLHDAEKMQGVPVDISSGCEVARDRLVRILSESDSKWGGSDLIARGY